MGSVCQSAFSLSSHSALVCLNHGVVALGQYSRLVANAVDGAFVPAPVANAPVMPRHLVPGEEAAGGMRRSRGIECSPTVTSD